MRTGTRVKNLVVGDCPGDPQITALRNRRGRGPIRPAMDPDLDPRLLALLKPRHTPGAGAQLTFTILEQELTDLFAALSIDESRALYHRLRLPTAGDRVAALFGRLAPPRRERLVAYLADARRRQVRAASGIR